MVVGYHHFRKPPYGKVIYFTNLYHTSCDRTLTFLKVLKSAATKKNLVAFCSLSLLFRARVVQLIDAILRKEHLALKAGKRCLKEVSLNKN